MADISRTRRDVALIWVCLAKYFLTAAYSVLAPFYPAVALEKGVDPLTIGFVLASFALVSSIVAPPLGKSISKYGSRFTFCAGCGLAGLASLVFACLDVIQNSIYFVIMCFLVRIIQAIGVQAGNTASVVIAYELFPDNINFILGISQAFSGLGLITGPTLGGLLYAYMGFMLPFLLLGGILLLCIPFCLCLLPEHDAPNCLLETRDFRPLLLMPGVLLGMLLRVISAIEITFLDSTLVLALLEYETALTTAVVVAVMFLLAGIGYGASAPFWGLIGDRWDISKELNLIGLAIGAAGYVLIGPNPNLGLEQTTGLLAAGLIIMGIGVGVVITVVPEMAKTAIEHGQEENTALYGSISGLYYFAYNLGMFMGPILGSVLAVKQGFQWSCTTISLIVVATFLLYALYVGYYRCSQLMRSTADVRKHEQEAGEGPSSGLYEPFYEPQPQKDIPMDDYAEYDEYDEYDAEKNPFYTAPTNYEATDSGISR
ncbi:MFS-type transporter SLC18B1-like [Ptychodera flava]|uniref:MFS-type transporter SLC18B1-like n=1 Tax=Ptychodera flava TaxID=63121 RepID=UPI00396A19C7